MSVDNTKAFSVLQGAIDALGALAVLPEAVAAEAAPLLKAELLGNIAAQRSPNGKAWQPSKDGKPVLLNAGKALEVTANGATITAKLTGPEARHHLGIAKGHIRRQILPGRGSLGGLARILRDVAKRRSEALINAARA